jgi:hypothetical protein
MFFQSNISQTDTSLIVKMISEFVIGPLHPVFLVPFQSDYQTVTHEVFPVHYILTSSCVGLWEGESRHAIDTIKHPCSGAGLWRNVVHDGVLCDPPWEKDLGAGVPSICPDVQQFKAGEGGELFGSFSTGNLEELDDFEWHAVFVYDYISANGGRLRTHSAGCVYRSKSSVVPPQYSDRAFGPHDSVLEVLPGYVAEVPFPEEGAVVWRATQWTDQAAELEYPMELGICTKSVEACRFYALPWD